MKYILTIILTLTIGYAQSFTVENVQGSQSTDGEHVLTVSYDLVSDGTYPSFMVHPEISINGGESWDYIIMNPIENILGDNIFAGSGKTFSIDLDDYYTGMYTNNALIRIQATGREATNLPSSFDNLFINIDAGEYMGGNFEYHNMAGEPEEYQIKNLDYAYEITKYHITNAQYAEFLIDVHQQNLISVIWISGVYGYGFVRGAFHGHGVNEPLLQEDCEYSYETTYEQNYPELDFGGDSNSNCENGYDWYYISSPETTAEGHIRFNGTTFVVEAGFGNHPVQNLSIRGAMVYAHHYGLRLPTKEEIIKAGSGMEIWDYAWGETPNESSSDSELKHYMNYTNGGFNNPWSTQNDNNLSRETTPVGYFNGSTYYYPEGFQDGYNDDLVYEVITENAVSVYGLYDVNGNVRDLTSTFITTGGWQNRYMTFGGSGWEDKSRARSRLQGSFDNGGSYGSSFGYGTTESGFRCVRTINLIND